MILSTMKRKGRGSLARLAFLGFLIAGSTPAASAEKWPPIKVTPEHIKLLDETLDGPFGSFHDRSYQDRRGAYDPNGDYFASHLARYSSDGEIELDREGLPKSVYLGKAYYNPVTLSQYALSLYGRYLKGEKNQLKPFRAAVEKLLTMQSPDGGFSYPIELHHQSPPLKPGWRSAMAQGQVLSVLSRAHRVFKDPRYLRAGDLAMSNLQKSVRKGGTRSTLADLDPSLSHYVWFPEYPYEKIIYTLNGYMFTLIGLYDWSRVGATTSPTAQKDFEAGILTLEKVIPYYDVDGYSAYDLGHMQQDKHPYVPPSYKNIHIHLLHGLNSLVSSPVLKHFEATWTRKVDALNQPLRLVRMDLSSKTSRVGVPVKIVLDSRGGQQEAVEYQFAVKHNGEWSFPQPYSKNSSFTWKPTQAGEYAIGFYVRGVGKKVEYDNFRWRSYTVTP
jgi:hypothetical protein